MRNYPVVQRETLHGREFIHGRDFYVDEDLNDIPKAIQSSVVSSNDDIENRFENCHSQRDISSERLLADIHVNCPGNRLSGWIYKLRVHVDKRAWTLQRCGFMFKASKRYFTLDLENRCFYYSSSHSSTRTSKPIGFHQILSVQDIDECKAKYGIPYGFTVKLESRNMVLLSKTEDNFVMWRNAFFVVSGLSSSNKILWNPVDSETIFKRTIHRIKSQCSSTQFSKLIKMEQTKSNLNAMMIKLIAGRSPFCKDMPYQHTDVKNEKETVPSTKYDSLDTINDINGISMCTGDKATIICNLCHSNLISCQCQDLQVQLFDTVDHLVDTTENMQTAQDMESYSAILESNSYPDELELTPIAEVIVTDNHNQSIIPLGMPSFQETDEILKDNTTLEDNHKINIQSVHILNETCIADAVDKEDQKTVNNHTSEKQLGEMISGHILEKYMDQDINVSKDEKNSIHYETPKLDIEKPLGDHIHTPHNSDYTTPTDKDTKIVEIPTQTQFTTIKGHADEFETYSNHGKKYNHTLNKTKRGKKISLSHNHSPIQKV